MIEIYGSDEVKMNLNFLEEAAFHAVVLNKDLAQAAGAQFVLCLSYHHTNL